MLLGEVRVGGSLLQCCVTQPQVAICSENKSKKRQRRVGERVFMCNGGVQTLFFMSECDPHTFLMMRVSPQRCFPFILRIRCRAGALRRQRWELVFVIERR